MDFIKEHGFQSTLPRGERHAEGGRLGAMRKFQSTLPRGERHARTTLAAHAGSFQSTLPRGERRGISLARSADANVSIHAPAWGATRRCQSCCTLPNSFNPRSRVGSDSMVNGWLILHRV